MRRALKLAERGWGRAWPNPLVGAVVVRDGEVVGEGWHREFGAAHAEVEALDAAGPAARGATVYVNVEPCVHRGKTPPCADALVKAAVGRVVVGCRDPNPEASGGVERLESAGIPVEVGTEREASAHLNARFFWAQARRRPFVTLKLALSLDGRIAEAPGRRTDVTGPEARSFVHRLRAGHEAVLVGRRTAEVDDPRLTVRGEEPPRVPPVRMVLDSGLSLSPDSNLARTARGVPVWVFTGPDPDASRRRALEERGVRVLPTGRDGGGRGVDCREVLSRLEEEGIGTLIVEGGGRVASSFLGAGLVERTHLLYGPVVFGAGGVPAFADHGFPRGRWKVVERRALGADTMLVLDGPELRSVLES